MKVEADCVRLQRRDGKRISRRTLRWEAALEEEPRDLWMEDVRSAGVREKDVVH